MAIVVSVIAASFDELARRALRQAPMADLVELRLDRMGNPGTPALAAFVQECPKPVIVSCPGPEAFGAFEGTIDERLELFAAAAEAGVRFVDVDWRLSLEVGELGAACRRIVSRHETEHTPEDLEALHEEVQAVLYEGDATKIVTHARSCEDGLRLLAWLRTTRGVVAFCTGEAGRFTRVLAPILGSPFTYCAPSLVPGEPAGEPTAPGQMRMAEMLGHFPPGGISQETAILGVVGNPVGHSWSPRVQGMALKAALLDAVYVAFEPESLEGLLALATDANFRGLSITAPFKEEAFRLVERRDAASKACGAVNTLVREEEGWRAWNTDVPAVAETLAAALEVHRGRTGSAKPLALCRVLVLGTGGAARAGVWAARGAEASVLVAGRRRAAADALAAELGAQAIDWDAVAHCEHDVLVNATPVGAHGRPAGDPATPIPVDWLRPGTVVLDAVYRPIRTPLLLAAAERDCTPVPGGEWFVRQAAEQFRRFTRTDPNVDLMREAFAHAHEDDERA